MPVPAPTNGYKQLIEAIRLELQPLKEAIDDTRKDVKTLQHSTYPREMMDEKLKAITDQLTAHEDDLKLIHRLIGNSWRDLLERVGVIAGIAYAAVYVIPHLFH